MKLSFEDRGLIGLNPYPKIQLVKNLTDDKSGNCVKRRYFYEEDGKFEVLSETLALEKAANPWVTLMKENPETAKWLVMGKCKEYMERIRSAYAACELEELRQAFSSLFVRVAEIYVHFGGRFEGP